MFVFDFTYVCLFVCLFVCLYVYRIYVIKKVARNKKKSGGRFLKKSFEKLGVRK